MEQRIIRNKEHWVVDEDGDVLGFDHGTRTQYLATVETNPLTGGIVFKVGEANLKIFIHPSGDVTGVSDTAAIQGAVNYMAALGGGSVILLDGLFNLSANQAYGSTIHAIRLLSNVYLRGAGAGATRLKIVATSHAQGYPGHVVFAENATNVGVRDVSIDGNRSSFPFSPFAVGVDGECGSGVRLRNVVSGKVENCEIESCMYHGVLAVDETSDVTVSGNRILDCGYRPVHYNTQGSPLLSGCRVINNYCYGNGAASDNSLNSGIFIALNNCRDIVLTGNHIENEKNIAIELSGGTGSNKAKFVTISGNTIKGCQRGIDITTSASLIHVSANTLSGTFPSAGSTVRGIGVTDVSNVVIQGNVVSGYGYGIGMSTSCHGVEVTDNVCFDNATSGIYLSNHAHYAVGIRGNNIRNSGVTAASVNATGIYIEGAVKQARVIENHIEGVKGHGVVLANLSDSIVSDNVLSNNYDGVGTRGRGIALLNTSDRVAIRGNNITNDGVTNNQNGIFVAATCTNISVIENHVETSAGAKIQIDTGATGRAYGNTGGTFNIPVGFTTGSSAL